jgi:hypothetical protein
MSRFHCGSQVRSVVMVSTIAAVIALAGGHVGAG